MPDQAVRQTAALFGRQGGGQLGPPQRVVPLVSLIERLPAHPLHGIKLRRASASHLGYSATPPTAGHGGNKHANLKPSAIPLHLHPEKRQT